MISAVGSGNYANGNNWTDIQNVERVYRDTSGVRYTLIATQAEDVPGERFLFPSQGGVRIGDANAIFTDGIATDLGRFAPGHLGRTEELQALALSVQVHEIGHLVGAGEADEAGREVYSGDPNDPTRENVVVNGNVVSRWSVMNNGASSQEYLLPGREHYVPFSIEELLTVRT